MFLEKFRGTFEGGIDTSDNTYLTPIVWVGIAVTLFVVVLLMAFWMF